MFKKSKLPMGYSNWLENGEKFGYLEFWIANEVVKEINCECEIDMVVDEIEEINNSARMSLFCLMWYCIGLLAGILLTKINF